MNSSIINIDGVEMQEISDYNPINIIWLYRWNVGPHSVHDRYDKFAEQLSRDEWLELARARAATRMTAFRQHAS